MNITSASVNFFCLKLKSILVPIEENFSTKSGLKILSHESIKEIVVEKLKSSRVIPCNREPPFGG